MWWVWYRKNFSHYYKVSKSQMNFMGIHFITPINTASSKNTWTFRLSFRHFGTIFAKSRFWRDKGTDIVREDQVLISVRMMSSEESPLAKVTFLVSDHFQDETGCVVTCLLIVHRENSKNVKRINPLIFNKDWVWVVHNHLHNRTLHYRSRICRLPGNFWIAGSEFVR